jgi:hypothetical protein
MVGVSADIFAHMPAALALGVRQRRATSLLFRDLMSGLGADEDVFQVVAQRGQQRRTSRRCNATGTSPAASEPILPSRRSSSALVTSPRTLRICAHLASSRRSPSGLRQRLPGLEHHRLLGVAAQ